MLLIGFIWCLEFKRKHIVEKRLVKMDFEICKFPEIFLFWTLNCQFYLNNEFLPYKTQEPKGYFARYHCFVKWCHKFLIPLVKIPSVLCIRFILFTFPTLLLPFCKVCHWDLEKQCHSSKSHCSGNILNWKMDLPMLNSANWIQLARDFGMEPDIKRLYLKRLRVN